MSPLPVLKRREVAALLIRFPFQQVRQRRPRRLYRHRMGKSYGSILPISLTSHDLALKDCPGRTRQC